MTPKRLAEKPDCLCQRATVSDLKDSLWQPGLAGSRARVSSFRKWIARPLRVLHTHTTYVAYMSGQEGEWRKWFLSKELQAGSRPRGHFLGMRVIRLMEFPTCRFG